MTRAGSKLVLRTSPAPGHYLCIKWDFASLPLRSGPLRDSTCVNFRGKAPHAGENATAAEGVHFWSRVQRLVAKAVISAMKTKSTTGVCGHRWAIVQRLVAKGVDVKRETALVVGSDNVLLGFCCLPPTIANQNANCCLNGVLSQWFVSQFGKIDGHI